MLDDLQPKIEDALNKLSELNDDIERMKSIEGALELTEQSLQESAQSVRELTDSAQSTQQHLDSVLVTLMDLVGVLSTLDQTAIMRQLQLSSSNQSRELESHRESLQKSIKHSSDSVASAIQRTSDHMDEVAAQNRRHVTQTIISQSASIEAAVQNAAESAKNDRRDQTAELVRSGDTVGKRIDQEVIKSGEAVAKRVTDAVTASSESVLNQVKDATTELDATTRSTVAPVKWVGVLTLLTSIAVLIIAVLIFLNN